MIREYLAPATVEQAVFLKEQFADAAVFLAGGTEVNSAAFPIKPEQMISLQHLGLADIRATGTELTMGACCTIQQLIDSPDIPEAVKAAGRHVFNRNIRNMATIGGQLGSNRSCSNLLPILVAFEAMVDLAMPEGTRTMPALRYISEERKEMITQVRIPASAMARLAGVEKYSRTSNDLSILTAAVTLTREGQSVMNPVIAAGGLAKHVIRLESVEQALHGRPLPKQETIEQLVASQVSPIADIRGSIEFKRHLAGVLVAKALLQAYHSEGVRRP